ncbi:MAG: excinuclease ABC subunit UvrA [Oligoflexia bacterium]|nr:excinuclease ABC subunit UvrA [Oligoflexia bacterium]
MEFPPRKISVVTGLSGSGKSSLVFDTLYAEGQRRYVESLSTYTRQFLEKMPKPDLDSIENIPPAIALEQKNHIVNSRSTVGTQTEIVDYLRVLYAKIGHTFCVNCGSEVKKIDSMTILDWAADWLPGKKAMICAPIHQPSGKPEGKAKKAKKKAASRGSKTSKKAATMSPRNSGPDLTSLAQVLLEQGFQRMVKRTTDPSGKIQNDVIDLNDSAELASLAGDPKQNTALYVVVDRLRLSNVPDADTRGRLLDSIDQAISIGNGQLAFLDLDPKEGQPDWRPFDNRFACIQCGTEHRIPEPNFFSFNSPLGACSRCSGFGYTLDLDEALVVPDPTKTIKNGALDPFSKPSLSDWQRDLFRFCERHGISIGKRYSELTPAQRELLWKGDPKDSSFDGVIACFEELKRYKYKLHMRVFVRRYQSQNLCPACHGARLKPEALAVKVGGKSISDTLNSSIIDSLAWIRGLTLTPNEKKIADEVFVQVERRLSFLEEVGVGYLTLSRLAKTLSGGEFQRINLATQLGNGLCGTLYVLDEPSIGLHAADTQRLIRVLERLRDQGNTVVVVEHDLEVMKAADWLVELGPGAGRRGGELVAQGTAPALIDTAGSITGKYLSGAFNVKRTRAARPPARRFLKLTGCRENNLKNLTVEFPLDRLVVVTGVSGSGKSTLVHKTLFNALSKLFYRSTDAPGAFDRLYGADQLAGVVLLDQTPIGRNSRSNPATYLKIWDEVRRIYANQVLALRRGYTPQHFSFNVDGGRCPVCKGEGEITLDMHFMAEVKLPCEECEGKRFKKSVLDVFYRGKNIDQLLHTTIDDAYELFRDNPLLVKKLGLLRDVGLGYLQLGQSATTLSGGESQRLKIASALDDRYAENMLYIFDEPTTGLHLEDVKKLMDVIHDLVDARHSVIMIEHHMDVIAQADWVIDLGPGGGTNGGHLVGAESPARLMQEPGSTTGEMLVSHGYQLD